MWEYYLIIIIIYNIHTYYILHITYNILYLNYQLIPSLLTSIDRYTTNNKHLGKMLENSCLVTNQIMMNRATGGTEDGSPCSCSRSSWSTHPRQLPP